MIAKCPCEHCGVNIEFATEEFLSGSSVDCPHCGKETFLYASPQAKPAPKPATPASPPPQKSSFFKLEMPRLTKPSPANKPLSKLIQCPCCGEKISNKSASCVKCGEPITKYHVKIGTVLVFISGFIMLLDSSCSKTDTIMQEIYYEIEFA